MALRIWVRNCLKMNRGVGDVGLLFMCSSVDYLLSPNCPIVPITLEQMKIHLQIALCLDYFACVPAYDLLCLDLVSPNCAMPQIPWSKYDLTLLVQLLHLSETSLDEKWGVKNFRLLFVYPCLRFRVFDPSI